MMKLELKQIEKINSIENEEMRDLILKGYEEVSSFNIEETVRVLFDICEIDESLYCLVSEYEGVIDEEAIDMFISEKHNGWEDLASLRCRIAQIEYDAEYYFIDVYGNVRNIETEDLEHMLDEIVDRLEEV